MLKTIISDFARTVLFPEDPVGYLELNDIHKREIAEVKNVNVFTLNDEDLLSKERLYPANEFFSINYHIINLYKSLKAKKVFLILLTNGFVHTHPDFQPSLKVFDKMFRARDLGFHSKREVGLYKMLCDEFSLKPEETLYIDDDQACLSAAEELNIHTIRFPHIKAYTKEQQFLELRKAVDNIEMQIEKLME